MIAPIEKSGHYLVTFKGTQFKCSGFVGGSKSFTLMGVEQIDDAQTSKTNIKIVREEFEDLHSSFITEGEA